MLATLALIAATSLAANGDVTGTVTDSANGTPIPSAEVTVQRGPAVIANTVTDPFGHFTFHDIANGDYTVAVHFIGFHPKSIPISVSSARVTLSCLRYGSGMATVT